MEGSGQTDEKPPGIPGWWAGDANRNPKKLEEELVGSVKVQCFIEAPEEGISTSRSKSPNGEDD